jgi:hypothetical protein
MSGNGILLHTKKTSIITPHYTHTLILHIIKLQPKRKKMMIDNGDDYDDRSRRI